ncbi:hypothetical protein VTL71DRAFT_14380 [Oculimacula yallundae]|uniref:UBC core domain-containing protein n=1 Tax=Oculimacula yallundae TaxID=86028 RepID=A0ABR4CIA7_9HELO
MIAGSERNRQQTGWQRQRKGISLEGTTIPYDNPSHPRTGIRTYKHQGPLPSGRTSAPLLKLHSSPPIACATNHSYPSTPDQEQDVFSAKTYRDGCYEVSRVLKCFVWWNNANLLSLGCMRCLSTLHRFILLAGTDPFRLMSDYEVTLVNDNMYALEFYVRFKGPEETPFQGGLWKVHVELPDQYPYKSPSIGFVNRIFHPNIDESGSVCLDVINQTWSPMFDMINIFEVFLPQLLRYPNPTDPLNGEAAALLMREPKSYDAKVKEYVAKYASKEAADEAGAETDDDDDMSSVGSFGDEEDEEPAGPMEEGSGMRGYGVVFHPRSIQLIAFLWGTFCFVIGAGFWPRSASGRK